MLSSRPARTTRRKSRLPRRRTRARRIGIGNEARSDPTTRSSPRRPSRTPGLFLVHRIGDKIFYEIPTAAFGKDLLWVTQLAATQSGYGYGGSPVGDRVVRWEQRGDDILLRDVKYAIRAEAKDPIRNAVEATSVPEIIEVFPVKAYGKDKAPVIDVTRLFTADLPEFSAKRRLNASGVDPRRTFIDGDQVVPREHRDQGAHDLPAERRRRRRRRRPGRPPRASAGDPSQGGVTVLLAPQHGQAAREPDAPAAVRRPRRLLHRGVRGLRQRQEPPGRGRPVHHPLAAREERPQRRGLRAEEADRLLPRPRDPRQVAAVDQEGDRGLAARLREGRLQERDPRQGRAHVRRRIPTGTPRTPATRRIRWLPATIENAMGPHVHDPRTGEILESDILMYHNVLKLIRDWYFVQASPNDPRAQSLPLPDDLIGELLAYVVAHEVGHTLGFPHNMKASSAYTVEQLRDPDVHQGERGRGVDHGLRPVQLRRPARRRSAG